MSHEDTPAEYTDPELTPARDARDSTIFLVIGKIIGKIMVIIVIIIENSKCNN